MFQAFSDHRYADPRIAMGRFLEITGVLAPDYGHIPLEPIKRAMLSDGASVAEHIAERDLALAEGLITIYRSGAYVSFTERSAEPLASSPQS